MKVPNSKIFQAPIGFEAVIELLKDAIHTKHFVKFYYESANKNKGWRIIPPYMIIPRKNKLELVGVPMQESRKGGEPRHYAISQLSERLKSKQLEICLKLLMILCFQEIRL